MKLYYVEVAPNPTKVRLYIAGKIAAGATLKIEEVRVKLIKGEQKLHEHLRRNPFASLPVLEISPGDWIIKSLSIMDYFRGFLSAARDARRVCGLELERIVDLRVLTPIGRIIHATKSPIGLPPSVDIAQQVRDALIPGLRYLDSCLDDGRQFIAGERVTTADCTLAAALQFARYAEFPSKPNTTTYFVGTPATAPGKRRRRYLSYDRAPMLVVLKRRAFSPQRAPSRLV